MLVWWHCTHKECSFKTKAHAAISEAYHHDPKGNEHRLKKREEAPPVR